MCRIIVLFDIYIYIIIYIYIYMLFVCCCFFFCWVEGGRVVCVRGWFGHCLLSLGSRWYLQLIAMLVHDDDGGGSDDEE